MAYYIDLFSPDTYQRFTDGDRSFTGFRERQRGTAQEIKPGDKLISYVTKLSRWVGMLEVKSNCYEDHTPFFHEVEDPFVIRFKVDARCWLPLRHSPPIHNPDVWDKLSFTKGGTKDQHGWTAMVRGSLRKLDDADGRFLEELLLRQSTSPKDYPLSEEDQKRLQTLTVRTIESGEITVTVPEDEDLVPAPDAPVARESIQVQALLAGIGEEMGLHVWLPRPDRGRVLEHWQPRPGSLVESLPLGYDPATMRTVELVDVLWIRGKSIIRAFEVEHTTSIFSGILRMADLMALQPNLNIKAHIVAPTDRRDKVLREIKRPVFATLQSGPLSRTCTFISYEDVRALSKLEKLKYMTDAVLEDYVEESEEDAL